MFIYNARLKGQDGLWKIEMENKSITRIAKMEENESFDSGLDAEGGLALPPFIEPHIHLDTTLTAGEPEWNRSGTLFEGIERWAQRKQTLSREDVKNRATRA